jgi:hypothetical protein
MTIDEQVRIMETQMSHFDTVTDKLNYLLMMFTDDPEYGTEAKIIVTEKLAKERENETIT